MATYVVTPADRRIPIALFDASDGIDLGEQVAVYLAKRGRLSFGLPFDAQIGDEDGSIRQDSRVITFDIHQQES